MAELRLYPVEDGYGERLPLSGIPRLVKDARVASAILQQVVDATAGFGLPPLDYTVKDNIAILRPARSALR